MTQIQDGTTNKRGCSMRRSPAYWLLVRSETEDGREDGDGGAGWARAHTVKLQGSEEALALFSFKEEAEMFARIEAGAGWVVWEVRAEELLFILREASAAVEHVFLDPLPPVVGGEMLDVVRLSRERFEDLLVRNRRFPARSPRSEHEHR